MIKNQWYEVLESKELRKNKPIEYRKNEIN